METFVMLMNEWINFTDSERCGESIRVFQEGKNTQKQENAGHRYWGNRIFFFLHAQGKYEEKIGDEVGKLDWGHIW